jgi:hypothetical protein
VNMSMWNAIGRSRFSSRYCCLVLRSRPLGPHRTPGHPTPNSQALEWVRILSSTRTHDPFTAHTNAPVLH